MLKTFYPPQSEADTAPQKTRTTPRNGAGMILAMIFAAAVAPNAVQARLGETEEECKARYGEAKEVQIKLGEELKDSGKNWEAKIYSSHGLKIQAIFVDGKAVFIKYSNEPILCLCPGQDPTVGLSISEISFLKAANSGTQNAWPTQSDAFLKKVAPSLTIWRSSDREFRAGYNRKSKDLFVCTKTFWDLVTGKIRDRYDSDNGTDAKNRLEGL